MIWHKQEKNVRERLALIFVLILLGIGCQGRSVLLPESRPATQAPLLLGYSIQTGAFSMLGNAVRMTEMLNSQGCDAFYFRHESGLFKVRLGEYSSSKEAEQAARDLINDKIIAEYYIIPPLERVKAVNHAAAGNTLRDQLVNTAKRYLSYPYTWGGDAPDEGFDCSGLVLAVYRLNGLNLPDSTFRALLENNSKRETPFLPID